MRPRYSHCDWRDAVLSDNGECPGSHTIEIHCAVRRNMTRLAVLTSGEWANYLSPVEWLVFDGADGGVG